MAEIAGRITGLFIRWGILTENDRLSYAYCFELTFIFLSNLLSILLLAVITKNLMPTIFYLVGFWPLRLLAGGYHAKTPGRCFAITLLFFLLFLATLCLRVLICKILMYIGLFISIFTIFVLAPVDCVNKPFREGQREALRLKSRFTVSILSVVTLFSLCLNEYYSYSLSFGMSIAGLSLVLSTIQSKIKKEV